MKELLWIIKKKVFWEGSSISFKRALDEVWFNVSALSISINFTLLEKDDLLRNFNKSLIFSTFISLSNLFFWTKKKFGQVWEFISL